MCCTDVLMVDNGEENAVEDRKFSTYFNMKYSKWFWSILGSKVPGNFTFAVS